MANFFIKCTRTSKCHLQFAGSRDNAVLKLRGAAEGQERLGVWEAIEKAHCDFIWVNE